jgi:hypothetical protein
MYFKINFVKKNICLEYVLNLGGHIGFHLYNNHEH